MPDAVEMEFPNPKIVAGLQVRDPEFLDILGSSPKLVELVKTDAHEGGAWYPDKDEFYFSSNKLTSSTGQIKTDVSFLFLIFPTLAVNRWSRKVMKNSLVQKQKKMKICINRCPLHNAPAQEGESEDKKRDKLERAG